MQLERAVRDLWTMLHESGDDYVVFTDRRRLLTRVRRLSNQRYQVSWQPENESETWIVYAREFDDPREAAFHGYQGPH